jgi:DinB superfamily
MNSFESLRALIDQLPARLRALPSNKVENKPAPDSWSGKEELGHLLDSAANNYQRIVRTQVEEHPAMPSYDGDGWVALQRYQERDWPALISLWVALNEQLLVAMEVASESARTRTLTIGDSAPLTLQFVFDDYVDHMLHHLQHMGVEVEDLAPAKAAAQD